LGQRSRKRGRREKREVAPAAGQPVVPAGPQAAPNAVGAGAQAAARRSRSEARNEAARAALSPLAPGERPWAVTVSAILATLVGGYNLVSYLLGAKLAFDGRKPGAAGIILFALVMFTCAAGMWRMRYWAVLGFQALLAILLLIAAMLLITVSNLAGLAVCLATLTIGGLLFFKLVKALGRIQLPERQRR
jgi:hypothetical protein